MPWIYNSFPLKPSVQPVSLNETKIGYTSRRPFSLLEIMWTDERQETPYGSKRLTAIDINC